jgi:hypothetical protein
MEKNIDSLNVFAIALKNNWISQVAVFWEERRNIDFGLNLLHDDLFLILKVPLVLMLIGLVNDGTLCIYQSLL